jgi:hypothetical protein
MCLAWVTFTHKQVERVCKLGSGFSASKGFLSADGRPRKRISTKYFGCITSIRPVGTGGEQTVRASIFRHSLVNPRRWVSMTSSK